MDIKEEKIIEEIKKAFAAKVSSSDEPCCKCGGKTPMEMRWLKTNGGCRFVMNLLNIKKIIDNISGKSRIRKS